MRALELLSHYDSDLAHRTRRRMTKKRREAQTKAVNERDETIIEFEPYYATEVSGDLTDFERVGLEGFVIREEDAVEKASVGA